MADDDADSSSSLPFLNVVDRNRINPIQIMIFNQPSEEERLDVPEEPTTDEDVDSIKQDEDDDDDDLSKRGGRVSTPLTFFTAVGIARWIARAYGYAAKKKAAYTSQDQMSRQNSARSTLSAIAEQQLDVPGSPAAGAGGAAGGAVCSRPISSLEIRPPSSIRLLTDEATDGFLLTGVEARDRELVCAWVARSFGVEDEEYHRAYSREVIRQARVVYYGAGKPSPSAWW